MSTPQGWGQQPGMGSFGAAPGMPAQPAQNPQGWGAPPPVAGQQPPPGMGAPQPGGWGNFGQNGAPQPPQQQAAAGGYAAPKVNVPLPFGMKMPVNLGGAGAKFKIIGGVVLAIVLAVGGVILKSKFTTPKGMLSYGSLGLDKSKPDADAMYTSVAKPASKWKKDAIFWSVNFQAVRADGTVDVSKGAQVVYVSPNASASHAKSVRSDSMKKYSFSTSGVSHKDKWGFTNVVEGLVAEPEPKCKIKDVMALLAKDLGNKTARVTYDPQFADFLAWHVIASDPKIDAYYSWEDCTLIK